MNDKQRARTQKNLTCF